MKKSYLLSFLIILFSTISIIAQHSPNVDSDLETSLKKINVNAHADIKLFKKNLSVDFNISEGKLDQLMVTYNLQPADIYMVLEIGKIINKPHDEICECYHKNHSQGWGEIAKELGIKPGSKEFHLLKDSAKGKCKNKSKSKKDNCSKENDQGENKDNNEHGNGRGHGNGNGKNKGKK